MTTWQFLIGGKPGGKASLVYPFRGPLQIVVHASSLNILEAPLYSCWSELIMTSTTVSLIAFAFIFGGALLGMWLSSILPRPHLTPDSNDSVKLGMGLVATMCALVLGLLIASAKTFYDTQSAELTELSAKTVLLDRAFAHYGPEANDPRALLRSVVERLIDRLQHGDSQAAQLDSTSASAETLFEKTQALSPKDDKQRLTQSQAPNLEIGMGQTRWLMVEQASVQLPKPLVAVLIFWLSIIFVGWGIFAPHNATVVATWFICALSVSCAIFLIIEMYSPYAGVITVSSGPLRAALAHLGQ